MYMLISMFMWHCRHLLLLKCDRNRRWDFALLFPLYNHVLLNIMQWKNYWTSRILWMPSILVLSSYLWSYCNGLQPRKEVWFYCRYRYAIVFSGCIPRLKLTPSIFKCQYTWIFWYSAYIRNINIILPQYSTMSHIPRVSRAALNWLCSVSR